MNIRQPTELGQELLAATPDVFSTLNWIVEHLFILHAKQKPRPLHILAGHREVSAEELSAWDTTYITVDGNEMVRHVRRDNHFGVNLAVHRLTGLFQFLKFIIWPRIFDGRGTEFLEHENDLNEEERLAIDERCALEAEQVRLIRLDIERVLADSPALLDAYHVVQRKDETELKRAEALATGLEDGIRQSLGSLADALETGNADAIAIAKSVAIDSILYLKLPPLARLNWNSSEFYEVTAEVHKTWKILQKLANRRYLKAFEDFCLSPQLLSIQARLFLDGEEGSTPNYIAMVHTFLGKQRESLEVTGKAWPNSAMHPDC